MIGGGDTGSDCVGTSNRHGAASVTQFELMPQPPEQENKALTWPYWPNKLRTSSSHDEGCTRDWSIATKEFIGEEGQRQGAEGRAPRMEGRQDERNCRVGIRPARPIPSSWPWASPIRSAALLDAFGVDKDVAAMPARRPTATGCYATNVAKVFAAGDVRRGQSLVVWAIREGRQCAREVDDFLMGSSTLPR